MKAKSSKKGLTLAMLLVAPLLFSLLIGLVQMHFIEKINDLRIYLMVILGLWTIKDILLVKNACQKRAIKP